MVSKTNYYKRQTVLSEVGEQGQEALDTANVIVIGAGGLGSPVLNYIVSAGIGNIHIYDFDSVEESNLHRQTLFSPMDIGKNKAHVAKKLLGTKNPLTNIHAYPKKFDESVDLESIDLIIDCTDNFKTKFLAHDLCYKNKVSFCIASIHKFEGQIQLFNFKEDSGCMRCLWEESPSSDCVQTCSEAGVIGATAGVIGSVQAMEVIKFFLGMNHLKNNENLIISLVDFQSYKLKIPKNTNCPLCGMNKRDPVSPDSYLEISYEDLKAGKYVLVNLTNSSELFPNQIQSSIETIEKDLQNIKKDQKIAILCQRGITSLKATKLLRELDYNNSFSIRDGLSSIE
jgi:adenylyltransferase/sulfurtransferase